MAKRKFALAKHHSWRTPRELAWFEHTMLGIVIACTLCIVISLCANAAFDPARDAKTALEKLADDYYIEYLYPHTLGSQINNPAPTLEAYRQMGLPIIRLRQLLTHNSAKLNDYASKISSKYVKCDTNRTSIRFFPKEPYGPRDYEVTFQLSCQGSAIKDSDWFSANSLPKDN